MNVMITGAAGGLGRAMACECGRRGYNLFLTDINESGLKLLQSGLERRFNVSAASFACDLTSAESVDRMMDVIDVRHIEFDMLLNVAGIDYEGGFLEREREKIVRIVSLNDEATLRITHAVLTRRRRGAHFTVLFVSSLASMFPMPLKATYAASKRFLLDFSTSLRREMKDQDVNAMAFCPGGLYTTQEAMQGIAVQGFFGEATANRLEEVARKGIDRALGGSGVYIPGRLNRMLAFFGRMLPRFLIAAFVYGRWKRARRGTTPPADASGDIKENRQSA